RIRFLIGALVVAAGTAISLGAQSAKSYTPPKTPWGDPDLQGIWPSTAMVGVPFERPAQFGTRQFLTEEEFKQRQKESERQSELDTESFSVDDVKQDVVALGDVGGPTSPPPYWLERGEPSHQSSLVVDPPDGRLPPMTPEGIRRVASTKNTYLQYTGFNSANELGPYDRCISRGVLGSMFPVVYNNGNQIVQAPGVVILRNEMIHETRAIPLDNRPTLSPKIRLYMGSSRGHFEGDTLVVKTTNFNGATGATANGNLMLTSDALELTEKFTRTGPDTMQYEVTVNDPNTWTRRWTASFPLRRDPNYKIFEYACHEGNHAMSNILSGSRADERSN
ncbi:MAG TPA: hypothetical protein VFP91_05760, partial [Vicinamibacterales bacterium]|nr:hypothetical protein [Vicinamibacterales bacterium]